MENMSCSENNNKNMQEKLASAREYNSHSAAPEKVEGQEIAMFKKAICVTVAAMFAAILVSAISGCSSGSAKSIYGQLVDADASSIF